MKTWIKISIGAGLAVATAVAGCFLYKKLRTPTEVGPVGKDSLHNVAEIMDEVLIESIEHLNKLANMSVSIEKDKAQIAEIIRDQVEKILLMIEKVVCTRHNLDIEEYYQEVDSLKKSKDPEIVKRLDRFDKIVQDLIDGKKIQVTFPLIPELNQEMVFKLYRTILTSHLFLHYTGIQEYLQDNPEATLIEITNLVEKMEGKKVERRERIMENAGITKKPHQDYRILLQQTYYTYYSKDPLFATHFDALLKMHQIMQNRVYQKEKIPEFTKDPIEMGEEEFNELYQSLVDTYGKTHPSIPFSAVAPALKFQK